MNYDKLAGNSGESTQVRVIGRPWVKGQSGNPAGRPKKSPVTEIFQELLDEGVTREAIKEQIKQTLTSRGMAGVLLLKEAAERIEGRVTQEIEMHVDVALAEIVAKRRQLKEAS
jgi:hypothetical protein